MATEKVEWHHQHGRRELAKAEEEEQVGREIDVTNTPSISKLCEEHKDGVPAIAVSQGISRREPTISCANLDDGSGNVTENCPAITQQAHHSKCVPDSIRH